MLAISLFVAFHIVSASGGSTDETCPSLSFREFNLKPPWVKTCYDWRPCDEHDGDCDSDDECKGDLRCGKNNCAWGGQNDCCYAPPSTGGEGCVPKPDSYGRDCSAYMWGCTSPRYKWFKKRCSTTCNYCELDWSLGCNGIDSGCCTADSPCKENDGDCDNDDDCEGDLICGDNNCIWGDNDDCCIKKSDEMIWEESKSSFQYPQCKRATRKLYIRGLDIASCKAECLNCRMCKKNSKCNAINVLDGKYCKLLDCTEPIQEPLFRGGTSYGWKSYFTKYSRSKPWRQILDENCVTACGRGGSCPKFCGLRGYCCKYGDASCPYMATKASPNGYTCVTQEKASVETWRQKDGADCWSKCGRKGGPCPNFCGSNGFCCRKGYGGCPLGAAKESPKHHMCLEARN